MTTESFLCFGFPACRRTGRIIRETPALRSTIAAEISQQPPARHEEIAAAEHLDETPQRHEADRSVAARHEIARAARIAAHNGILLANQAVKGHAPEPGLLDEFELPLDVAVQTHEQQTRMLIALRLVETSNAQDAVAVGDFDLLCRSGTEAVARIGAADVGAVGTAKRLGILFTEEEIVVGPRRRPDRRLNRR